MRSVTGAKPLQVHKPLKNMVGANGLEPLTLSV